MGLKTTVLLAVGFSAPLVLCGQAQRSPMERHALESLSRANPDIQWDASSAIMGNIACDGRGDLVYVGHAGGNVYVGLYRAADRKPRILEFSATAATQDAVCGKAVTLTLESLDYDTDNEVEGFRRSSVCKGLELTDSFCDPFHLFWNTVTKTLSWWRS